MNFIIFDISKLLNALTLSKRLMGWRTKINSYTVNTRRIVVVVYIYVYWLIFGHLSNDYELSAIKIRAEIYFRVKKSFFGRKFIFDLAEKYTTEISSEKNQIVFRKVTNLISKCPDDSIYILFFLFLAVFYKKFPNQGWEFALRQFVVGPFSVHYWPSTSDLTWFLINKSEMTKAKIIWPYNVLSLISNQSRKNQMRLISDRFENFLWSRRTKSPHFIMCSLVINLKSADFKIFLIIKERKSVIWKINPKVS